MNKNDIHSFADVEQLFKTVAADFKQRVLAAVQQKGEFSVVLSGGNTPAALFDTLTQYKEYRDEIPWSNIKFFFGDERYVPSDDTQSNYHMVNEHLFTKVAVTRENIYRIPTEFKDPQASADEYEMILRKAFQIDEKAYPAFDLLYLGLGSDGHTASLLPDTEVVRKYSAIDSALTNNHHLVAASWVPKLNMHRITLTPPAINHALSIIFLVTGADKASAVHAVLEGIPNPKQYPAQLIAGLHHATQWYLDEAAGHLLKASS